MPLLRCATSAPSRSGVATVEFAIVAPFLLILIFGIWEIGRAITVTQDLTNAAREGARLASIQGYYDPSTSTVTKYYASDVTTRVRNYMTGAGYSSANLTNLSVNCAKVASDGTLSNNYDPSSGGRLDHFRITVSVNYGDICWGVFQPFFVSTSKVSATADFYGMYDDPFQVNYEVPGGP